MVNDYQNGSTIKQNPPISMQSRPQTINFQQKPKIEEPIARIIQSTVRPMRVTESRNLPPYQYQAKNQTIRVQVSPPKTYQSLAQPPRPDVVHPQSARVTMHTSPVIHFPAPAPVHIA